MCLSVYLGSHEPVALHSVRDGALGIEEAKWTPPPLSRLPYIYYLGMRGHGGELGCSCLLHQHVDWTDSGPVVCFDKEDSLEQCPFEALRSYVKSAQKTRKPVVLVCDDSGGVQQDCSDNDYDHMIISADMINAKNFLFVDPIACFPWRVFYLTSTET